MQGFFLVVKNKALAQQLLPEAGSSSGNLWMYMENKKLCSTPAGEHLQLPGQCVAKKGGLKSVGQALWGLWCCFTIPEASKNSFIWWESQKKILTLISAVPLYRLGQVSPAPLWG